MAGSQLHKRMLKELRNAEKDADETIQIDLGTGENIQQFTGLIIGPDDTPYAGGKYEIEVSLPTEYPFKPPSMRFKTSIWHPNVSSNTGAICMDVLTSKWLPVMTVVSTLRSIQSLLSSPQPDDPIDGEVAAMLRADRAQYWTQARRWAITKANAPTTGAEDRYRENWMTHMARLLPPGDEKPGEDMYKLYNRVFVDKLVDMGFTVAQVVEALDDLRVRPSDTENGEYQKHNLLFAVTDWILQNRNS